jgi:hypothetical protein
MKSGSLPLQPDSTDRSAAGTRRNDVDRRETRQTQTDDKPAVTKKSIVPSKDGAGDIESDEFFGEDDEDDDNDDETEEDSDS